MNFHNDAARFAYEQKCKQNARRHTTGSAKKKKGQPGKLEQKYKAVQMDTGRITVESDDIFRIARCVGVSAGQIAWAIRTGGTIRYDHAYQVVPVERE